MERAGERGGELARAELGASERIRVGLLVAADGRDLEVELDRDSLIRVVTTATSLRQLGQRLKERELDVVVLCRPTRSVAAAIQRIKEAQPSAQVLVLSDRAGASRVLEALRAGAGGFLHSSASQSRIVEAIRELHEGGSPLSAAAARALVDELRSQVTPAPAGEPPLSPRESDLLVLLARGHSYKTAARELGISVDTVRFHIRRIYRKLQVHSKLEAVLRAAASAR